MINDSQDWELGQTIGNRYTLTKFLGEGVFGKVWRAKDIANSTSEKTIYVALKLLPVPVQSDPERLTRTLENYHKVYSLYHHNIAAYTDLLKDGDTRVLVMEFVDGQTLAEYRNKHADKRGKIPLSTTLQIASQIAAGLDFAHGKGLVHCDIKLDNVIITDKEDVKILDFGIAAKIRESMSWNSQTYSNASGIPPYWAPEQVPQPELDQYALASLVYELLAGYPPLLQDCVQPESISGLTEFQNRALRKALDKEPENRFTSCTVFVAALTQESPVVRDWIQSQEIKVGSQNRRGLTLMHLAAKDGRVDVLAWLGIQEESVHAKDDDGKTPLFYASIVGHLDVIDWLITQGADVNARTNNGQTSMHYAASRGQCESLRRLQIQGADINAKDNDGQTPMFCAAVANRIHAVVWLKTEGANINTIDNHGQTPLLLAVRFNCIEVIRWLREQDSDKIATEIIDLTHVPLLEEYNSAKVKLTNLAPKWVKQN